MYFYAPSTPQVSTFFEKRLDTFCHIYESSKELDQEIYFIVCYIILGYLGFGAAMALILDFYGVNKFDASARDAKISFRVLILPSMCLLWPVLLIKWIKGK